MLNCLFMQFLVLQAKLSKKCVEKVLVVSAARSEYLQCMTASAAWRLLGPPVLVPYLLTSPGSGQLWAGEVLLLLLPWPPLVTSPDIWLHNWDNNSSGGKHLIKTLCSIWTAEYCKLFTQLEGKQGWTLRGFVFTRFINIYSHFKIFYHKYLV